MDYNLARRLVEKDTVADINPNGLTVAQVLELEKQEDMSASDWQLLYDIEMADKKRPKVLSFALEQSARLAEAKAKNAKKVETKELKDAKK